MDGGAVHGVTSQLPTSGSDLISPKPATSGPPAPPKTTFRPAPVRLSTLDRGLIEPAGADLKLMDARDPANCGLRRHPSS